MSVGNDPRITITDNSFNEYHLCRGEVRWVKWGAYQRLEQRWSIHKTDEKGMIVSIEDSWRPVEIVDAVDLPAEAPPMGP